MASHSPANEVSQREVLNNTAKKAVTAEMEAAGKTQKAANLESGQSKKSAALKVTKKKIEGATLIGIDVSKEKDFPGWYQQVLTKGNMLDYYDVSGCFILKVNYVYPHLPFILTDLNKPASYSIWEEIQQWLNGYIKKMGVRNCSFPLFVSEDVLQREKDHIKGFAPEVAWVTHGYDIHNPQICLLRWVTDFHFFFTEAQPHWRRGLASVLPRKPSCTPTTQSGSKVTVTFLSSSTSGTPSCGGNLSIPSHF